MLHDLYWPKTMTWTGLTGARFIRPIRWIVGLLDGKPLKFSYGGLAASDVTRGHRFLGAASIRVKSFADYEKSLRSNGVLVRPSERLSKIESELAAHAKKGGYRIHPDAELLKLVTYLNEFPTVIQGDFDPAFLNLPDEILVTVMRGHQKYFAVEKRNGELAPHFLAVINLAKDSKGLVASGSREGAQGTLCGCAIFFGSRIKNVGSPTIFPSLNGLLTSPGSAAIVTRLSASVRSPAGWLNSGSTSAWWQAHVAETDRAAELAKCDLSTEWSASFLSFKVSSVDFTQKRKASLMKFLTRSTITTVRWGSTIPFHAISLVFGGSRR